MDVKATLALLGLLGELFRADPLREGQRKLLLPRKLPSGVYLILFGDAEFLHSVWPEGAQTTPNIN